VLTQRSPALRQPQRKQPAEEAREHLLQGDVIICYSNVLEQHFITKKGV
jgi:hypothetical protein